MQVELDLGVAPFAVFPLVPELEIEIAAGTYLKQSQVRIMGATANSLDQGKTTVNIDLVPLGEKFDSTTARLTYERFWLKKVPINMTLFGDYSVVYVRYPGNMPCSLLSCTLAIVCLYYNFFCFCCHQGFLPHHRMLGPWGLALVVVAVPYLVIMNVLSWQM